MTLSSYFMESTVRSTRRSRVILESIAKMTVLSGLIFNIIVHASVLFLLQGNGLLPELIGSMVVLDACLLGGGLAFIIIAEVSRRGTIFEWLGYMVSAVIVTLLTIMPMEYFNVFDEEGFTFMPVPTTFVLAWIVLMLVSLVYLLVSGPVLVVRSITRRSPVKINKSVAHRIRTVVLLALPASSVVLAMPFTAAFVAEGTVKRTVTYPDTNTNATLSVWDLPSVSAQVPGTRDIDIGLLTENETRLLTALGRMNTTFYGQIHFSTASQANYTVARLKLLEAFNCTVCVTIWYSKNISEYLDDLIGKTFPSAHFAEDWVANARATLEFVIGNNITNVIGICADSEGTSIVDSMDEYWENINIYEDFLQEVQSNSFLRNPRPGQATFETVLCTSPRNLMDMMDGDADNTLNSRQWAMTSPSWTKFHFMLYRSGRTENTAMLYDYLLLLQKQLGVDVSAPVTGLTGVRWFHEGYFEGTYPNFGEPVQEHEYDGIDGWEAMKREIFIGKAMGFYTSSVFHLDRYENDPAAPEYYGLLDYYGIDAIEELADEWNQEKTIEYPISSLHVKMSTRGLFSPHDELLYDVMQNIEMVVVQIILFVIIALTVLWNVRRSNVLKARASVPQPAV